MVYIFEGLDRTGKSTQIELLKKKLEREGGAVFTVHCDAIKSFSKDEPKLNYEEAVKNASKIRYSALLDVCRRYAFDKKIHFIFDRAHLGEAVYSPMYRNYSGDYVFDMELMSPEVIEAVRLFVFVDTPENLIKRDDGESFSNDIEKKKKEIELFIEAYKKTHIKNSYLIDISEFSIEDVAKIIEERI